MPRQVSYVDVYIVSGFSSAKPMRFIQMHGTKTQHNLAFRSSLSRLDVLQIQLTNPFPSRLSSKGPYRSVPPKSRPKNCWGNRHTWLRRLQGWVRNGVRNIDGNTNTITARRRVQGTGGDDCERWICGFGPVLWVMCQEERTS